MADVCLRQSYNSWLHCSERLKRYYANYDRQGNIVPMIPPTVEKVLIVYFFRGQQGVLEKGYDYTVATDMPARDYCIVSM